MFMLSLCRDIVTVPRRVAMRYAVVRDVASMIAILPLNLYLTLSRWELPTLRELLTAPQARLVLLIFSCLVPRRRFLHTLSRSLGTLTVKGD